MKIAFYANRMFIEGDFLTKIGTGGSESALINLTRSWKKNFPEDEVVVFNGSTIRKQEYEGVKYKSVTEFKSDIVSNRWDAFISLRDHDPFLHPFINAKIKCLWSQDDMNEIGLKTIEKQLYMRTNIDLFFVISQHSKNSISSAFPEKDFVIVRNGYNSDINKINNESKKLRAIYTSTPFRGLDVLAEVWKDIYDHSGNNPELRIFSGMGLYRQDDSPFLELYNKLNILPNVKINPPISQYQLYKELQESTVMLYPNHFLETGCMAVTEALANGCWVITTDLGALGEQVRDKMNGNLIPGNSRSTEYKDTFTQLAINYFKSPLNPYSSGLIFSWDNQSILMRKSILERI